MMKKTFRWLGALAVVMMCACSLSACGGDDDDDNGSGSGGSSSELTGWYIRQDLKGHAFSFMGDDVTYSYNMQGEIIAVRTMPWGSSTEDNFSDFSWDQGYAVYYIPDDETFIRYYGSYYRENAPAAAGMTLLYKFNYGNLGTVGLYAKHTSYYTYWREGNKLYTTEGGWKVYTVTPSGIIPDGGSFVFSKYDPDTTY